MAAGLRPLLIGPSQSGYRRYADLLIAGIAFSVAFVGYAIGWFETSGGVVFLPEDAAIVGLAAAGWIRYRRTGLVVAWLAAYGALLGAHADHAFLGLPRLSFADQLRYFIRPDGLAFLGVEGVVGGTLGFIMGWLLRVGHDAIVREDARVGTD